ncbi:MAG: endonuclease/exonuclease/phosphatase family protein [Stackebrandtia sp.]
MVSKVSRRLVLGGAVAAGVAAAGGAVTAFADVDGESEAKAVKLPLIGPANGEQLHVMSFNIRTAADRGQRSWDARLPRIVTIIKAEKPTLIGTQEGKLHQIRDLKKKLSEDYGCVYRGREKDGSGECCAIFYRKDRIKKLNEGHRWLSPTPEAPGSIAWGAKHPRMFTWIQVQDRETGEKFYHVNTHFDHKSGTAREKSAHAIRDWMKKHDNPGIVTGDFNTGAGTRPHATMIGGDNYHDAWNHESKRVTRSCGTANLWHPRPRWDGRRIDWIVLTKDFDVHKVGINTWVTKYDNLASDHWPVQALVSLGN